MDLDNEEFRLFAAHANMHELRYMVIGGFAMYLNGLARNTEDVDVWIEPTKESGRRLMAVLSDMGYDEEELSQLSEVDFTQPQVFGLNNYIDILTYIHRRFDFNDCYLRSRTCRNDSKSLIHFLHLNDLREQKVVAHRPQDLRDIVMIDEFLEAAKKRGSQKVNETNCISVQLISYNINGIRAALRNDRTRPGLIDWLAGNNFDVLCFQEVKATADVVDLKPFEELGYQYHWHAAEKKGYSGVATFSRIAPTHVVLGCGLPIYDCEGRILRTDFGDLTLLNCYFPSGTTGEVRQGVKMGFLRDFFDYVQVLRRERPNLIVVGDYNIAHNPIDIHDPIRNKNTTGFLPDERAWMDRWFASGITDAFRYKHPDAVAYSWWSYRAGARSGNRGWRIDYACVTEELRDRIVDCRMLPDAVHADHCPVWLSMSE